MPRLSPTDKIEQFYNKMEQRIFPTLTEESLRQKTGVVIQHWLGYSIYFTPERDQDVGVDYTQCVIFDTHIPIYYCRLLSYLGSMDVPHEVVRKLRAMLNVNRVVYQNHLYKAKGHPIDAKRVSLEIILPYLNKGMRTALISSVSNTTKGRDFWCQLADMALANHSVRVIKLNSEEIEWNCPLVKDDTGRITQNKNWIWKDENIRIIIGMNDNEKA